MTQATKNDDGTERLAVPTIHLNGTPAVRLLEGVCNARDAIESAIIAVRETEPNGRDYYTQGSAVFTDAVKQHLERIRKLESVSTELQQIAIAIADAGGF